MIEYILLAFIGFLFLLFIFLAGKSIWTFIKSKSETENISKSKSLFKLVGSGLYMFFFVWTLFYLLAIVSHIEQYLQGSTYNLTIGTIFASIMVILSIALGWKEYAWFFGKKNVPKIKITDKERVKAIIFAAISIIFFITSYFS